MYQLFGYSGSGNVFFLRKHLSEDQTDDEKEVIDYINNVVTPKSSTIDAPSPSGGSEVVSLLDSVTEKVMYGQETAQEAAEEFFTGANEILAGK